MRSGARRWFVVHTCCLFHRFWRRRLRGRRWFLLRAVLQFDGLHALDQRLVTSRKHRLDRTQLGPELQLSPGELVQPAFLDVSQRKLLPDARTRIRNYRMQQRGHDAQRLRGRVQDGPQASAAFLVRFLRDRPGLVFHDVLVDRADQSPHALQRARELVFVEQLAALCDRFRRQLLDRLVAWGARRCRRRIRHLALEIALDHAQRAAGKVSVIVGQVGIEALQERVERERSVVSEHHFTEQEIAQRVHPEHVDDGFRAHDVAARFRHLVLLEQQPSVRHDRLGQRQPGGHQERRPVDAVEAHDFLADHVHVSGPVVFELLLLFFVRRTEPNRADVIRKRVEPDVDHVLRIVRYRDAPLEGAAADRQVAQPAAHERRHFVPPRLRPDELRILLVVLQQLVFEGRELEEIILFVDRFGRAVAQRARLARPRGIHVQVVEDAVLSGVRPLVDVSAVAQAAEQFLHTALVLGIGGADELVVAGTDVVGSGAECRGHLVAPSFRVFSFGPGRAFHVHAVFVGAGQEKCVHAQHALAARNRVANDGGVGVPNVRPGIDVVDRRRDVELAHRFGARPQENTTTGVESLIIGKPVGSVKLLREERLL